MTLTYRSLARLGNSTEDVKHLVEEQFRRWLHDDPVVTPRRFNADLLESNATTLFNAKADVVLIDKEEKDGSRTLHARLTEVKEDGGQEMKWVSSFTLHQAHSRPTESYFLYETDSPNKLDPRTGLRRPVVAGNPGLLRRLIELEEILLFDGEHARLSVEPRTIDVQECDLLLDIACDPTRRGALVLLGTDESSPFPAQYANGKRLFQGLFGIATSFVLTPEATQTFNATIGTWHSVLPGSVRSYFPEVDPAITWDAKRHPFVKREKIEQLGDRVVKSMLTSTTRQLNLDAPLPRNVQRVEDRMTLLQNEVIISGKRIFAFDQPEFTPAAQEKLVSDVEAFLEKESTKATLQMASTYLDIQNQLHQILEFDVLDVQVAEAIVDKFKRFEALSQLFNDLQSDAIDLRKQVDLHSERIYDLSYEYQAEFEAREKMEFQHSYLKTTLQKCLSSDQDIRNLKQQISNVAFDDHSWLEEFDNQKSLEPNNFEELLDYLDLLEYLEFTGDRQEVQELDRESFGAFATKTWAGLRMLNDFVRAKVGGVARQDVFQFLKESPAGYFSDWSTDKYAAKESESVSRNASMREARTFPVPVAVHPAQEIVMLSHLKVTSTLRVHFFEDVARSQKIYIGYIGSHLPTVSSN
jgi:hypothetical protein